VRHGLNGNGRAKIVPQTLIARYKHKRLLRDHRYFAE
jgi:hypothetical protein